MKKYCTVILIYVCLLFCFPDLSGIVLGAQDTGDSRLHTVVIDPGHGGKDPGAVSKDRKTYEKDLVLSISKLLGKKIKAEYGDAVNVLYTRTTDVFVPLSGRAAFANKNNADIFISIHINASDKNPKACGHSAHVLGPSSNPNRDIMKENLELCKRENSVIMLEDDYQLKYQDFDPEDDASCIFMSLMQSAYYEQSIYFATLCEQQLCKSPITARRGVVPSPFYVLKYTAMPTVLLELGFITNINDLAALRSEANRDKIAQRIFEAFRLYKKNYDESMNIQN